MCTLLVHASIPMRQTLEQAMPVWLLMADGRLTPTRIWLQASETLKASRLGPQRSKPASRWVKLVS